MSASAIARILKVTDKTVAKALRHYESGRKGTEPSAYATEDNRLRAFMSTMGLRYGQITEQT